MRRFLLTTLIIVSLFALFSPSLRPKAIASSHDTSVTVNVDGTQPWTDTGIDLSSGNSVSITASGTVYFADGPALPYGPNGDTSCTGGSGFTAPGLHCFSLVGNIANG